MGDYSSSTAYKRGQYVYSNALVWRAEQDVTNVTPAEGNINWQIVRTYKTWDSSTSYTINSSDPRQNSYVRHSNKVWRALKANTDVEPGTDSTTWVAGDACGKLLKSCKIRYQALPRKVEQRQFKQMQYHTVKIIQIFGYLLEASQEVESLDSGFSSNRRTF